MAGGPVAVTRHLPGLAVAALILALGLGTLAAVLWRGLAEGAGAALGPADLQAIRFTLWQAILSATLSAGLAIPVARAFARRRFPGRAALILLTGAPFILPVIVAVLGLLAVFGRGGLVNGALVWAGLPPVSIYGLQGVVLAHVFFNLPLAVRLILQGWGAIPAERFRLAESLGFGPAEVARHLERPMLRAVLPGVWVAIFVICLSSFAVALTLGGGPRATTVELAIYQAFRFDFDLGRAALLAGVQIALCLGAAALAAGVARPAGFGAGMDRPLPAPGGGVWLRLQDALAIGAAALFLLLPLALVALSGLPGLTQLGPAALAAAGRSLALALASTALCLALALPLADAAARSPFGRWFEAVGLIPLATSSLVLGTGLFLILRGQVAPAQAALPVTMLVNAVMALPFALRAVLPPLRDVQADYGRLAAALDLRGAARWRLLVLPRLRAPIGFSAGLAAALSAGDLGVITLFADGRSETLPLHLYRLMGAYRMEAAMGAALLLTALSLGLFWIFDRGGRHGAATR
ncbi:ABC transporter permease family protein [Frigidibacter oleivorans]|uniref:thiamine/thiamine pyrophosphate ABC transporter permease ThiP n=1 Tax=Frigidibacter oleivorans TaxID=2487129 RepID=UPI000F8F19EC|nr:thiamine/thiamine pyrophosphate ABC transporter permease ThiP [Frigidibacter oleivorans]